jgi:basic membrane protein A
LIALVSTLGLITSACGDDKTSSSGSSGDKTGPKVGLAFDTGGEGDKSFNDAALAGVKKAESDLGATVKSLEPKTAEDRAKNLNLLVEAGRNPVVAVGFAFGDDLKKIAPANPKTTFAIVDSVVEASNVKSLVFAEEQGSFLVGAAAGLKTKTNKVGFIGGVEMELIKKFEAGFVAGVKATNPNATVDVKYISPAGDFSGFGDPAKAKEIATGMYEGGEDVVFHAAGGSGNGLFEAAAAAGDGKWAIGVDSDQYLTASADQQKHILTSMLKRVDVAVYGAIKDFADGKTEGGTVVYDLSKDGVGYSTSGGYVDDIKSKLDGLKADIVSGKITVPTAP